MAKKYYSVFHAVMQILKETCKLLERNKTIFLFIALATTTFKILLLFTNPYLTSPQQKLFLAMISLQEMDPEAPEYLKQVSKVAQKSLLVLLLDILYLLLMTMFSSFFMVSTVYVSAMSYSWKDLTLKELCLYIKQIWVRPLITLFYAFLISLGLLLLLVPEYIFLVVGRGSLVMLAVGIILLVLVAILGVNLLLFLNVGIVTSVLEDLRGLGAIGKARRLLGGQKRIGFILMFIPEVPSYVIYYICLTNKDHPIVIQFLNTFLPIIFQILLSIWSMMTYTVFYFKCKEIHGEQVEFHEEMGYMKVSTISSYV